MSNPARQKKILVVDDDIAFLTIIEESLKEHGYKITTATDGRKAAHAVAANDFDLIISDVQMPDVSGIHLLQFVKKAKKTPLILMTGNAELGRGHEVAALLKKPFAIDALLTVLRQVLKDAPEVERGKKTDLLKHTADLVNIHLLPSKLDKMDASAFDFAKTVLETTMSSLADQGEPFMLLGNLRAHSDELYVHSLGVALISSILARNLNWSSPITLFKVSAGALLHDIGMKDFDLGFIKKLPSAMSTPDRKRFESHPTLGATLLQRIPSLPSDVIQIVNEHHEQFNGEGFPAELKKNRIHPLARVVKVADDFCDLAVFGGAGPLLKPVEAIHQLWITRLETYDYAPLAALSRLFGIQPKEEDSSSQNRSRNSLSVGSGRSR